MNYLLVDCNNFFVSCERVFAPRFKNRAAVVLSSNDGCIVARSDEVKIAGIPMGAPYFKYHKELLALNCKVFSSNFALYGDMSARVMQVLTSYLSEVEVYSIDEAFMILPRMSNEDMIDFARDLQTQVYKQVGIPVSVGIGPSKTLAKLTNNYAKKERRQTMKEGIDSIFDGVMAWPNVESERTYFLERIYIQDVWGIGRAYSKRMQTRGVFTAKDFLNLENSWIKKNMGILGLRIWKELQGQSCLGLEMVLNPNKNILSSRSFSRTVTELDYLVSAVSQHVTRIGQKLRKQKSACTHLTTFLITNRFVFKNTYYYAKSRVLDIQSSYTPDLLKVAIENLKNIYKPGLEYKKCGVVVDGIIEETRIQTNLFDTSRPNDKTDRVSKVIDKINRIYGRDFIRPGTLKFQKTPTETRSDMVSQRYTTVWSEILQV